MEERSRPLLIMGEEDGRIPAQWVNKNIDGRMIVVGVCAMAKKTNSKPMKEILARLHKFEHLQIIVFEETMILNDPVDTWPIVDALISFFSNGFPLQKAIEYKNLRRPFVVNDLEAQYLLFDRREVYKILVREGVAHPRYAILNRNTSEEGLSDYFEENEDAIEVNGVTFQRPFVEKPVCAEDHNIYIYFPVSAGGGCQKLFRKVGSRSSVYSTINRVRKTGSYVYEDFMPTDGTDVKVYTVGPDYAHAEARKSPALDGKVERDKDGKEIRYPVLLSASEKMTARKVCMAFKQNVCGFDLLRANGKSYVCDVNGFSFVKNSTKYYDDCANVLGTMIVRALAPQLHIPLVLGAAPEDIPVVHTTSGSMMELRCVVAIIRHGDRTPKQKMKMEVKNKKFFELFEKYGGYKSGHLKLKKPKQLQEILDIARDLLSESDHDHDLEVLEKKAKLRQLKLVLEMYGHFSGINRKVQLKYQPRGAPKRSSSEEDEHPREPSLVLIVKWGGELTPAGKFQAEDLGKAFRTLYPGGQGEFETPGLGFLRLHSTFRHDLKIYASDEGRVQMTAAAFTKGLLALEGELTPILVSMVKSANTNGLLDKEGETSKYQHVVKEKLLEMLNEDRVFTADDTEKLCPTNSGSLLDAMKFIENPRKLCDHVFEMVRELTARIKMLKMELKSRDLKLYHGESWELLIRRWAKLEKDFKLKSGNYDISKIPDIYDCIKYDLQHNQKTLQYDRAEELFMYSKALADIVIPQEYGIKVEEKLHISQSICTPLLRKIHSDLVQVCQQNAEEEGTRLNSKYSKGVASPERFVRTRLYFTSESHIHSLLNMFRYGGLFDAAKDEQWKKATDFLSMTSELNYMTQINIMMFEDPSKEFNSPERFHVELHFSPGAYTSCDTDVMNPVSSGYRTIFHARQMKKSEDNHKLTDNGKKDGIIHDGIIHEEAISEVGSQEELFYSKEDSDNRPCVYRLHVHETETSINHFGERTVHKPLILIDKVMKSDIGISHSEKATAVADIDTRESGIAATAPQGKIVKHGFGIAESRNQAVKDVGVGTATANMGDKGSIAVTASQDEVEIEEYSVSEVTLCPETDTDVDSARIDRLAPAKDQERVNASNMTLRQFDDETDHEEMIKGYEILSGAKMKTEEIEDKSNVEDVQKRNRGSVSFNFEVSESDNTGEVVAYGEKTSDGVEKEKMVANTDNDDVTKTDKLERKTIDTDKEVENLELEEDIFGRKVFTIGSQDDLDELVESLHDSDNDLTEAQDEEGGESVPEPKSPDPDIPEWDWGDNSASQDKLQPRTEQTETVSRSKQPPSTTSLDVKPKSHGGKKDGSQASPSAVSRPLTIEVRSATDRRRTSSFDNLKTYEEGRSRSLEDKVDDGIALMEKHYLTIHLPINKDRHHHSFSSLLYLNPEAFRAFDGFNMVPSLKPLETLHNNLTLKEMDAFLSRATTTKFFTPVSSPMYGATPLMSPRLPEAKRDKSGSGQSLASTQSTQSLPSSSNSSAGPSSPTSVSTPVDFFSKLKMFMLDPQKVDQAQYTDLDPQAVSESDLPSYSSSASDSSLYKSGFPYGASIKSDAPCSSSCVPKVQNIQNSKDGVVNQRGKVDGEGVDDKSKSDWENLTLPKKAAASVDDDEHEKTLTALSSDVSKSLKIEMGQSEDCVAKQGFDKLSTDFMNKVSVAAGVPTSPTSLSQRIPPELAETLKLDVHQDTHKSAFKKVGKRFKMSHVPEESLKLASTSGMAAPTENARIKTETENSKVAVEKQLGETVDKSTETAQYASREKLGKGENKKLKVKSAKNCNVSANRTDTIS